MPVCRYRRAVSVRTASCSPLRWWNALYRWSAERGYDNPSVYCHDHAAFIRHAVTRLHEFGLNGSLAVSPPTVHVS